MHKRSRVQHDDVKAIESRADAVSLGRADARVSTMMVVLRCAFLACCWWTRPSSVSFLLLLLGAAKAACYQEDPDFAFPSRVRHCGSSLEQEHPGAGGICPWDNTCCDSTLRRSAAKKNGTTIFSRSSSSACIPSDLGARVATCCYDDDDDHEITSLRTGCGVGYRCYIENNTNNSPHRSCLADPTIIQDPLVQVLPRYHLCQFNNPYTDFSKVWGFSSPAYFGAKNGNHSIMPYYSSHGNALAVARDNNDIRAVLIIVHGANRNADDYFCSAAAALQLAIAAAAAAAQQHTIPLLPFESIHQVLILAPRFMVRSDFPFHNLASRYLHWEDTPNGPWRYGASAISSNKNYTTDISSFQVLDAFLAHVLDKTHFPHLQHVTLAGHSSGGQMVQRWALLSPVISTNDTSHMLRVVVANPSSYAYLTPLRYNATTKRWAVPEITDNNFSCPGYNQWEWGLDTTESETPNYVQRVLDEFASNISSSDHPYQRLVERFLRTRRVIYLQGSQDRCNVSSAELSSQKNGSDENNASVETKPWCESHGLETTCADELQGSNRWERNERYMEMLQRISTMTTDTQRAAAAAGGYHRRVVVPGVGHDHSLMFASPEGLRALFATGDESIEQSTTTTTINTS